MTDLQEAQEVFRDQPGPLEDPVQGAGRDRPSRVDRHHELPVRVGGVEEDRVAARLPVHDKPGPHKDPHEFPSVEVTRELAAQAETVISSTRVSSPGIGRPLDLRDSRYRRMASAAFSRASSRLLPQVITAGRAGTTTVNPPPSSGSRITRYLRVSSTAKASAVSHATTPWRPGEERWRTRIWLVLLDGRGIALLDRFPVSFALCARTPEALRGARAVLERARFPLRVFQDRREDLIRGEPEVTVVEVPEPLLLPPLVRALSRVEGADLYDADIDPAHRYLVARDLFPLGRVAAEHRGGEVLRIELLEDAEEAGCGMPELRVVRLRIAGTLAAPPHVPLRGELEVEEDGSVRAPCGEDPRTLLESLRRLLLRSDPDVLLAEYGDSAVLPPLLRLSRTLGIPLPLCRDPEAGPSVGRARSYMTYGRVVHRAGAVELRGRLHLDLQNSFLVRECGVEGLLEAARIGRMPLQRAARVSPGAILTAVQEEHALRRGVLVPYRRVVPEGWRDMEGLLAGDRGGIVLVPPVGAWDDVAEIDFSAQCPTLIVRHNLSAETVNRPCCAEDPETRIPGSLHRACRRRRGIVAEVVERVLERRMRYRRLALEARGEEQEAYRARQRALKWLSVVAYGYLRFKHARWGRVEAHEATTAPGREAILRAKEVTEGPGYAVLHALVDSLFVHRPGLTEREAEELAEAISREVGIPAEVEAVYSWAAFCGSRMRKGMGVPTRYFARRPDGTLKVRGIAVRRWDVPGVVREVQEALLAILSGAETVEEARRRVPEALEVVEEATRRLRSGEVRVKDLAVRTVLSRDPLAYRAATPQAVAARQLVALGVRPMPGEEVAYVVGQGRSKVPGERGYALGLVERGFHWDYDPEWYCRAVRRSAEEVLEPFRAGG